MDQRLSDGVVVFLRRTAVVIGLVFIIVAFAADMIGLSAGTRLSTNQIAFGILGLILVLGGILGRRFFGLYRGFAVLLLNVIVAIVLMDFLALVLVKIIDTGRSDRRGEQQEERPAGILNRTAGKGLYTPYVEWRSNPAISSDTLTISEEGYRLVPGTSTDPEAYRVFLFGGSAMWGVGASDSCTIGGFLQTQLSTRLAGPVAVYNFGQLGFSTTQEVIELMLQLRDGNLPDLVVFYDGVNDVANTYTTGEAGGIYDQELIAARVEGRSEEFGIPSVWNLLIRKTNLWFLITMIRGRESPTDEDVLDLTAHATVHYDADSVAEQIAINYLSNCRIVETLAEGYDFDCMFILQPCAWVGNRLHAEEDWGRFRSVPGYLPDGTAPEFAGLLRTSYRILEHTRPESSRYRSFACLLDDTSEPLYSDFTGTHLNGLGNSIVAGELIEALEADGILPEDLENQDQL